jgi:hypothetical protein
MQQLVRVVGKTRPADGQLSRTTRTNSCIYTRTLLPPDDGQLAELRLVEA